MSNLPGPGNMKAKGPNSHEQAMTGSFKHVAANHTSGQSQTGTKMHSQKALSGMKAQPSKVPKPPKSKVTYQKPPQGW